MAELVEHLKEYSYDRFDILTMWDMNELPEFVHTDFGDGNTLADEVLGTTLDEDMEEASNSPEAQASRDYQERQERRKARLEERKPLHTGPIACAILGRCSRRRNCFGTAI